MRGKAAASVVPSGPEEIEGGRVAVFGRRFGTIQAAIEPLRVSILARPLPDRAKGSPPVCRSSFRRVELVV